ncbi:MAG: hypothetical protein IKC19_09865 [Bacteroidales bacterium]|nr:hypothetical protein [Bacteroidales bacterium]
MKRKILTMAGVALLLAVTAGCGKQKTCRCAVMGTSTVRIVEIDKGECNQLNVYTYHTPLDVTMTDSLLCTDYEFMIDSIYND